MIFSEQLKEFAFSILDRSKQRGFHLFKDLKFYSSQFNLPAETIFDVGANIGQTSRELRKYFPNSSIHAFEPVNSTFEILKKNISQEKNIILNNTALGAEEKEIIIRLQQESLINSLLNEIDSSEEKYISSKNQNIQVLKGDNYFKANNLESIFLLKTDTEGYDLDVLKGFEQAIVDKKVFTILVEVTFDKKDSSHTSFYSINEYLTRYGYNLTGFYDLIHHGGFLPNLSYCNCLYARSPNN